MFSFSSGNALGETGIPYSDGSPLQFGAPGQGLGGVYAQKFPTALDLFNNISVPMFQAQMAQNFGLSPDISAAIGLQRSQLESENERFNKVFDVISSELGAGGGAAALGKKRQRQGQPRQSGPTLGKTFESGQRRANPMLEALGG